MKRILIYLSVLLISLSVSLFSQGGEITRSGYVDIDEVMRMLAVEREVYYGLSGRLVKTKGKIKKLTDDIKEIKENLDKIYLPVITEMSNMFNATNENTNAHFILDITNAYQTLEPSDKAVVIRLNDDLEMKREELSKLLKEAESQQLVTVDVDTLPLPVKQSIYIAVKRVAKREGYSMIFERFSALYVSDFVNITPKVLEELRYLAEKKNEEALLEDEENGDNE